MKYLVFDCECCDGYHICELGYLIFNDNFEIIDQKIYFIDPKKTFRLTGRKNSKDFEFKRDPRVYQGKPTFDKYYNEIKQVFENPNIKIIGHALTSDADFINRATIRYKLEVINFTFYDSQKLFSRLTKNFNRTSLENIASSLNIPISKNVHTSLEDSKISLRIIKDLLQRNNLTLNDVVNKYHLDEHTNFNLKTSLVKPTKELLKLMVNDNIGLIPSDTRCFTDDEKYLEYDSNNKIRLLIDKDFFKTQKEEILKVIFDYDYQNIFIKLKDSEKESSDSNLISCLEDLKRIINSYKQ